MLKRCCSILLIFCVLMTASGCRSFDTEAPASEAVLEESAPVSQTPAALPAPASPTPEALPTPELPQRERDWVNDLNYLKKHYKLYHKDPFYYCSEEEFDFKIDQLSAKVGELSDNDIVFELTAIMAGMGDIHTRVGFPESVFESFFPVNAFYFGDKLYLAAYLEGYDQFEPYLLQEIVAVNGVDIKYIQKKIDTLFHPNNIWYSREVFSRYYAIYPAFFDWAGCGYTGGYTFQILNENNEVETVEVPVLPLSALDEDSLWVSAEELYSLHYLERGNWAEYFEEEKGDYVYMSFTELESLNEAHYRNLFETTAQLLATHPDCGKLVIDLRSHPGGRIDALRYIPEYVSVLKEAPIEHTYVLIGGYTVSAAIECLDIFKDNLDVITVGEPTGQFTSFFYNVGTMAFTLPHSQLVVLIADHWNSGAHPENELYDENGRLYEWENTVLPDVFVSQDIEDIRQGKDSVIQWILEQE